MDHGKLDVDNIAGDEVMEMIVQNIQSALDSTDLKEIYHYIDQISQNVWHLSVAANFDKIRYVILKFLVRIVAANPTIRSNACESFVANFEDAFANINFEKQALLELKSYLNNCKKTKDYSKLSLSFVTLTCIIMMHDNRNEKISSEGQIWFCGIKGIHYTSAPLVNNDTAKLQTYIEKGIQLLKTR